MIRKSHGRVTSKTDEASRTKQGDAHEANINTIIGRYRSTGDPSIFMRRTGGAYLDVSSAPDYQACLDIVREGQEAFDEMPANIRKRFRNNPAELMAAIADPEMHDELRELGVLEQKAPPKADAGEAPSPPAGSTETTPKPAPTAPKPA